MTYHSPNWYISLVDVYLSGWNSQCVYFSVGLSRGGFACRRVYPPVRVILSVFLSVRFSLSLFECVSPGERAYNCFGASSVGMSSAGVSPGT